MKYKYKKTIKNNRTVIAAVLLALLIVVVSSLLLFYDKDPIIPAEIKKHITFQVYIPEKSNLIQTESIKYDETQGILSFTAYRGNNKLYFTQQSTPDPIKDIPQYYAALLGKLNEYSEFKSNIGTVTLTKPKELNGNQTAVINAHDTLMFIRPEANITDNEWKEFINSLIVYK